MELLYMTYATFFIVIGYFVAFLVIRRIVNVKYDKKLGIKTIGIRKNKLKTIHNRTESTPYLALESLFKEYTMNTNDKLVDFGSGRGRVAIFIHNKFKVSVTGIELNTLTYNEAVDNVDFYTNKYGDINKDLNILEKYAEKYNIKKDDNKFFFFNPFHISIFQEVVRNIIESSKEHKKQVEIILYYPLPSYIQFIENETRFILKNKIKAKGSITPTEKFLIYTLNPQVNQMEAD